MLTLALENSVPRTYLTAVTKQPGKTSVNLLVGSPRSENASKYLTTVPTSLRPTF
jgi:hypothetical protein